MTGETARDATSYGFDANTATRPPAGDGARGWRFPVGGSSSIAERQVSVLPRLVKANSFSHAHALFQTFRVESLRFVSIFTEEQDHGSEFRIKSNHKELL